MVYIHVNRYFLHRLNQRVYFSYLLPYFLPFLLDTSQAQRTFMSPRLFNSGETSNVRQASANLSHLQFPPNCPRLSNPPRPYGYLHCYPRLRNFSPTLPPNITVGPTSVPRMLGSPMPDQLNMFVNYSGSHRDVTNQVGAISLSACGRRFVGLRQRSWTHCVAVSTFLMDSFIIFQGFCREILTNERNHPKTDGTVLESTEEQSEWQQITSTNIVFSSKQRSSQHLRELSIGVMIFPTSHFHQFNSHVLLMLDVHIRVINCIFANTWL